MTATTITTTTDRQTNRRKDTQTDTIVALSACALSSESASEMAAAREIERL